MLVKDFPVIDRDRQKSINYQWGRTYLMQCQNLDAQRCALGTQ